MTHYFVKFSQNDSIRSMINEHYVRKTSKKMTEEYLPLDHDLPIEMPINIKFLYLIVSDDCTA